MCALAGLLTTSNAPKVSPMVPAMWTCFLRVKVDMKNPSKVVVLKKIRGSKRAEGIAYRRLAGGPLLEMSCVRSNDAPLVWSGGIWGRAWPGMGMVSAGQLSRIVRMYASQRNRAESRCDSTMASSTAAHKCAINMVVSGSREA